MPLKVNLLLNMQQLRSYDFLPQHSFSKLIEQNKNPSHLSIEGTIHLIHNKVQ